MKIKSLLILVLSCLSLAAFAQEGGVRGTVVSRNGRAPLDQVKVSIVPGGVVATSDAQGNFVIENLDKGEYTLLSRHRSSSRCGLPCVSISWSAT